MDKAVIGVEIIKIDDRITIINHLEKSILEKQEKSSKNIAIHLMHSYLQQQS